MKFIKQLLHSAIAVSAIICIVVFLMLFGAIPFDMNFFLKFLIGAILLIVGQSIFLVAIDGSIIKLGRAVGSALMKRKNIWIIVLFGFLFGLVSTIAEPDVQVLVNEITGINSFFSAWFLLSIFGIGCGLLVCFGLIRIVKSIPLKWVLLCLYGIVLILWFFVPESYIGIAIDGGGVTTGSVTVPFILALTIGICAIRGTNSKNDSFGLIAITSIGPIIAILLLGIIFGEPLGAVETTSSITSFSGIIMSVIEDVSLALSPLILTFIITQFTILKLPIKQVFQILFSFIITAIGLVVFLVGVYYGFSEMGTYIGNAMILSSSPVFILLFGLIIGFCIVFSDPAIIILANQVDEVTSGLLRKKVIYITLGIGVALAICLAFVHVIFSVNLLYFVVPLYIIILTLNFFIPKIFTAISFDSGGIASGTMSVAFILPICLGMCETLGNNLLLYGFGIIGLIATVPILTVQLLGLIYKIKSKNAKGGENDKQSN